MKEAYLIFDLGTGNSRIALISPDGEILAIKSFENTYYQDSDSHFAKYFIPDEWLDRFINTAGFLISEHPQYEIIAITATSAREGIVLIDRSGKAFLGLPNIDKRGLTQTQYQKDSKKVYQITGHWLDPLFSALKLTAYRETYPDKYNQIASFTSLSEWIGYELTGHIGITPSHACETQLFDTNAYRWSDWLCSLFSIDRKLLPELYPSGSRLGSLKKRFLKPFNAGEETPFILSGADTQTAVCGVNADPADVVIVSGTTSPIVSLLDAPLYDEEERCWLDCTLDGKWMIETNAGTTGLNYQTCRNTFLSDTSYEEIEKIAASRSDFNCIASFGTKLFSEKLSIRQGGFLTSAPFSPQLDRFDLARAILADIACGIALHYEHLCHIRPHQKPCILGCGGGFQSRLLGQWTADLTQKEIILPQNYEQASLAGCLHICNHALHNPACASGPSAVITAKENPELQNYYKKWMDFRKIQLSMDAF